LIAESLIVIDHVHFSDFGHASLNGSAREGGKIVSLSARFQSLCLEEIPTLPPAAVPIPSSASIEGGKFLFPDEFGLVTEDTE